ncbi:MAG: OmpA family protein [Chitinispirillaceae bacterium]
MSRLLLAAVAVISSLLLLSTGCRKQKSVLKDATEKTPVEEADTNFQEVFDFSDVDTSSEAVFTSAQLSEELTERAREALKPVYFEYNSYDLSSQSMERLTKIAKFLKENGGMRILIEGHCDVRGSSQYNIGLGENRAKTVKEYLINYGVDKIRMETTSFGKEKPVESSCSTEECHSKNRRSEFRPLAR